MSCTLTEVYPISELNLIVPTLWMEDNTHNLEEDEVFIEDFGWAEEDTTTNGSIELSNNFFPGLQEGVKLQQSVLLPKPSADGASRQLQLHAATSSSSMPYHETPTAADTAAALQNALQSSLYSNGTEISDAAFPRAAETGDLPGSEASASPATALLSLPALVQRLLQPGRATDETNDICISIMLHPDLSVDSSALGHYTKMSAGLRNYSAGSSHAWLYTPRKHPNRTGSSSSEEGAATDLALIFVFPDEIGATVSDRKVAPATKGRNKLHFGGRAFPLWNNSVLLQHGAHKPLGLKARKFKLAPRDHKQGLTGLCSTAQPIAPPQLSRMPGPSVGALVHATSSLSSVVPPPVASTSRALSLPEPSSDPAFERDVEQLREGIHGSDLKRKLALLSEVWAREIMQSDEDVTDVDGIADGGEITANGELVATGAIMAVAAAAAEEAASNDDAGESSDSSDSYDPHRQKRSKARGGAEGSDCAHLSRLFNDVSLDDAYNDRINLCVEMALTYSGSLWPEDAVKCFKLNYRKIQFELYLKSRNGDKCLFRGVFESAKDLPPFLAMATC